MDALAEDYLAWSPFNYTLGNPIRFIDPDGNGVTTKDERDKAVAKAKEYVAESSGTSASYGDGPGSKGGPGEAVDCSGLVSGCIEAAGLPDPIDTWTGGYAKGTTRIKNQTTAIDDVNDVEAGNGVFIDWSGEGGTGHTGLISSVERDDEGNVTFVTIIHSGSSTGPTEMTLTAGDSKISSFYKWDTPDPVSETPASSAPAPPDSQPIVRQDATRLPLAPSENFIPIEFYFEWVEPNQPND